MTEPGDGLPVLSDDDLNLLAASGSGSALFEEYRELKAHYATLYQEYREVVESESSARTLVAQLTAQNAELRGMISESLDVAKRMSVAVNAARAEIRAPQPGHQYVPGEELSPTMVGEG